MKRYWLAISGLVIVAVALWFTAFPYTYISSGGCPPSSTESSVAQPESLIFDLIISGGKPQTWSQPQHSASDIEYGCSPSAKVVVIPLDLYAIGFILAIVGLVTAWKTSSRAQRRLMIATLLIFIIASIYWTLHLKAHALFDFCGSQEMATLELDPHCTPANQGLWRLFLRP